MYPFLDKKLSEEQKINIENYVHECLMDWVKYIYPVNENKVIPITEAWTTWVLTVYKKHIRPWLIKECRDHRGFGNAPSEVYEELNKIRVDDLIKL